MEPRTQVGPRVTKEVGEGDPAEEGLKEEDTDGPRVWEKLAKETHGIILLSVKQKEESSAEIVRGGVGLTTENHRGWQTIVCKM